ncbi:MAG TPA: AMP-binding protein [Mycobacteriales bacterium]|jgi:O-succinylbenzoic acid--CoA ligase|nr:AMP-binding protein [Mycobacteriales bacterium]HVX69912.1 AMP-binding protein [Mycobacteriales bacterium]
MPARTERSLVSLAMPPGEEFIAALESSWSAGHAVLPLDPTAPPPVRAALLGAMGTDQPVADDVALVIATSGSTGVPKGVELTHTALEVANKAVHARIGLEPDDVWLSCLPWHHVGGLQVMLRARRFNIPLVVHERFEVTRFASTEATLASLVPTQLVTLLDEGVDLRRFRVILLGGGAASRDLLARARSAGVPVVTTYGMSETAGGCVYDGVPLDGVDVTLRPDGRIALRGPMLMKGYRLRPDLTAAVFDDGWLVTNDLGAMDEDGRLRVLGRADDVIVTGGENVVAGDVADELRRHAAIADAEVIGMPDRRWGQRVVAVIVSRVDPPPSLAELREWCRGALQVAALPRQLVVVAAMPRLSSGKPDRMALLRIAEAEHV